MSSAASLSHSHFSLRALGLEWVFPSVKAEWHFLVCSTAEISILVSQARAKWFGVQQGSSGLWVPKGHVTKKIMNQILLHLFKKVVHLLLKKG